MIAQNRNLASLHFLIMKKIYPILQTYKLFYYNLKQIFINYFEIMQNVNVVT